MVPLPDGTMSQQDERSFEQAIRDAVAAAFRAPHLIGEPDALAAHERADLIMRLRELRVLLYNLLRDVERV